MYNAKPIWPIMIFMSPEKRTIRSYVLRQGRMTEAQKRALTDLTLEFGVPLDCGKIHFDALFGRNAETVLEIGFGMGHSLVAMAKANSDINFLGVEVHKPGVGRLFHTLKEDGLTNVKAINQDVVEVLTHHIDDNSLQGIHIYFPDPWPKKKHHKRRLVQTHFISLLCQKLKEGGYIHLATDWAPYAEHMVEVLSEIPTLKPGKSSLKRPETRFEQRGKRLGHEIVDLVYEYGSANQ